jgi:hypothetical protein
VSYFSHIWAAIIKVNLLLRSSEFENLGTLSNSTLSSNWLHLFIALLIRYLFNDFSEPQFVYRLKLPLQITREWKRHTFYFIIRIICKTSSQSFAQQPAAEVIFVNTLHPCLPAGDFASVSRTQTRRNSGREFLWNEIGFVDPKKFQNNVSQRVLLVVYRRFGTTYQSHLQEWSS